MHITSMHGCNAHATYPNRCKYMSIQHTNHTHTDPRTHMNIGAQCIHMEHIEEIHPNVGTHAYIWTLIHRDTDSQT